METYEELTPHLVQLINETNSNPELTESQKQDEISLHMMGFVSPVPMRLSLKCLEKSLDCEIVEKI